MQLVVPFVSTAALWALFAGFDFGVATAIGLINSFICIQQLVKAATSANSGPVAITFWSFTFSWVCVGSLAQLSFDVYPWPDSGTNDLLPWAQLLLTGALVAYIVGGRRSEQRFSCRPTEVNYARSAKSRLWLPAAAGLALLAPVLALTGGIAGRFATRLDLTDALTDAGLSENTVQLFLLNRLPAALALVVAYGAASAWRSQGASTSRRRASSYMMFLLGIGLLAIFANPFSNSRYVAFSALAGLLLGVIRLDSRKSKVIMSTAMAVGMLVIYPLASWFKKSTVQSKPLPVGMDAFLGIDFDGFQMTVNTIHYVNVHGIAYGEHILAAVGYFVPRAIWTNKPIPASFDVAAERGYSFQNLSLPLWSELYLDLGLVGMIIAMYFLGRLSRQLDLRYAATPESLGAHMAVLFAVGQFGLIRGPLGGSFVFFGTVILVGLAVYWDPRGKSLYETSRANALLSQRNSEGPNAG